VLNRGQRDFAQNITHIKKSGADSILLVLNSVEGAEFVKEMGKSALKLPVVSHWGIIGGSFFDENKKLLKSLDLRFIQTFSFFDQKRPAAQKLAKAYMKTYGKSSIEAIDAPAGVAQAYDAVHLLALAVQKAGSTERQKVRAALENLPVYEGALKTYAPAFTARRHDALEEDDFFMARFGKNGQIVPIAQEE